MRLNLNKTLRAALIAAITTVGLTLTQASGAITSDNAAGWAVYQDSAWKTSDSFVGDLSTTGESVVKFKDAGGTPITFGSGDRSAYTFAVELDLSKFTTPGTNTSMVWGSNKVGFGVNSSNNCVTAAIGSGTPRWGTAGDLYDLDNARNTTITIVVSTGNQGSRIYIYDADGTTLKDYYKDGLKEGNPSTEFHLAQAIKPAVTKFAVWQTGNGTASANDMKDAYSAMADFPLAPPTEYTWAATGESAAWDTTSTVWDTKDATGTKYVSSASNTATFGTGEGLVKDVAVSGAIKAGTVNVNDGYTFTVASDNSLTVGTLSVAAEKTATVAGAGTISLGALSGAGKLALGENTQVSLGAISGTNTFSLADGSVLEMAFSGLPATITAEGTGAIRLLKGANQNTNLTTITAPILKLAADSSHNSRFVYNNSSNLSGVQNLYFDGAQLWLNSGTSALNFAGTVTFGTENHYSESANLDSAMRVNSSAKFSGAVDVQKDAKITWQAGNQSVEFAGAVTGSGNLTLATYNNGPHDGSKFIIGGDASQFAGALNVNHASITLEIKEGAKLNIGSGSDLKGAVSLNGELSVNGNAAISGNITGTGTITKTGAGELILSGAGNALTHTLQVNAGKLTISGSIAIDGIEDGEIEEGYVTARGEKVSDGNGFAYKSGILNVYNVEEGAELVNNGSFTYGGEAVTVDQDGRYALSETVDHTTLWVNSGTESYDTYHAASEGALTTAKVAGGATLAIGTNAVGTLAFKENGTTINVTGTGTVNAISGTGTLNLEEDAVVTLAPQGTPSAPTLSGAGTLALAPSANVNCTITGFSADWTGTLEINGTNGTPTLYLGSGATAKAGNLHMAAGAATIRLNGNTAKAVELDEVVMEKGTKLLSFYANYDGEDYPSVNMSIGVLTMKGDTATVGTTNHGGLINIGSITGSGTLTLTYESSSDAKTVLNLGGEDVEATTFHGTLDVYHNNNGNKRTTTLILNDEYTAADAVVQFRAVGAGTNSRALGIGLHADTVKVAGLNDGTIGSATGNNLYALYSGDYTGLDNRYDGGADFYEKAGDGETRTLEITGDGEYSTAIKVLGHVNLLMTGTGTQTFTGDMSEFNGTLTLKAGTIVVNSALGEDAVVTVEGDATLGGDGIDAAQVGIAADKTATFEQGITDASGVVFYGEEGVQVKNTNEAGGAALLYDITKENAQVTAAMLYAANDADVTVANKLEVVSIVHTGTGALTLTKVDADALTAVSTDTSDLTIKGISETSLTDLSIGTGATVAVYVEDTAAAAEGTVTITETLTAGGAKLLANLTLKGGSTLDLSGAGENALTLGSTLTVDTATGLILLDEDTIAALEGLALGHNLDLFKALEETKLDYGSEYNGTWFDAMFVRTDAVHGDYLVYATEDSFGLTKVSNVPEPTTGTLSLLALMALAARRRRK